MQDSKCNFSVIERLRRLVPSLQSLPSIPSDAIFPFCHSERSEESCGRKSVLRLTSGQRPTAEEGIPLLRRLVEAAGKRIVVMPGCGVTETNVVRIASQTGAREFHLSARTTIDSRMRFRNPEVTMGAGSDEYLRSTTSAERVRRTLEALRSL